MIKIENKIVGVSLGAESVSNVVQMHERLERPEVISGKTYKVKSPLAEQSLYITINDIVLNEGTQHEQRRPFEIFINSKNMEAFQWIVGLTRMMSAVFRKGGDVTFVVDQLRSVHDPRGGYIMPGGVYMPSVVAEIGMVVERHLIALGLLHKESMSKEMRAQLDQKRSEIGDALKNATPCPKCNIHAYVIQSGCGTCLECGYSKCG